MKWVLTTIGFLVFSSLFAQNETKDNRKLVRSQPHPDIRVVYEASSFQPNQPDGSYKLYFQNRLLLKGYFKRGFRHGAWIRYYPSGDEAITGNYVNGQKHGKWNRYFKSGTVAATWSYYLDQPAGQWSSFTPTGDKRLDIVFDKQGRPTQQVAYYEDGKVAVNHDFDYSKGITQKTESNYYRNYSIAAYRNFKKDQPHGSWKTYHRNKIIFESYTFDEGQLVSVGTAKTYNGQLRNTGTFSNGSGILKRYQPNGLLFSTQEYVDGTKNGSYSVYDNGIEAAVGQYSNGRPIGTWHIDDRYHNPQMTLTFDSAGHYLAIKDFISSNNMEALLGFYDQRLRKTGTWRRLNYYNEEVHRENYRYDFLHGEYIKFRESTSLKSKGRLAYGEKIGSWRYFNSLGTQVYEEYHQKKVMLDTSLYDLPDSSYCIVKPRKKKFIELYREFDVGLASPDPPAPEPLRYMHLEFFAIPAFAGTEHLPTPEWNQTFEERFIPFKQGSAFDFKPSFIPPRIPTDLERFNALLDELLKYTQIAIQEQVHGEVWLRIKIDELGFIQAPELMKSLGYGLDESALMAMQQLPPFMPARYQGLPVPCYAIIALSY